MSGRPGAAFTSGRSAPGYAHDVALATQAPDCGPLPGAPGFDTLFAAAYPAPQTGPWHRISLAVAAKRHGSDRAAAAHALGTALITAARPRCAARHLEAAIGHRPDRRCRDQDISSSSGLG